MPIPSIRSILSTNKESDMVASVIVTGLFILCGIVVIGAVGYVLFAISVTVIVPLVFLARGIANLYRWFRKEPS